MPSSFVRAYPPAQPAPGPAFWLPFRNNELVVQTHEQGLTLIQDSAEIASMLEPSTPLYLGTLREIPCLACEVDPEAELLSEWRLVNLRALFGLVDDLVYNLAGYASQLLYWRRTSRYCPVCSHQTEPMSGDWGRHCPNCGHTGYPRVSPAILALVHNDDQVLLTHKPGWGDRYSIIAGFVEPGESLEECVKREVCEEVGVDLTDLVYVGSQSWPFPHQLMVGYMARYAGGEIRIDTTELDDANWFHVDKLPSLPAPLSLSRQMIDIWVASQHGK